MADETEGWGWYASENGEFFAIGPEPTREAAIAAAIDDRMGEEQEIEDETGETFWRLRFTVAECLNRPVALADWIGADRLLETAEEALADSDRRSFEFDDSDAFEASVEQKKDLIDRVRRACDEWQAAHGLVFTVNTFEAMRREETVTHRLPKEPADG